MHHSNQFQASNRIIRLFSHFRWKIGFRPIKCRMEKGERDDDPNKPNPTHLKLNQVKSIRNIRTQYT